MQYLAQEEAAKNLLIDKEENVLAGNDLLEDGIQGTQKPILPTQSPRQKLMNRS